MSYTDHYEEHFGKGVLARVQYKEIDEDSDKIEKALAGLQKDKLIKFKKNNIIEINSN